MSEFELERIEAVKAALAAEMNKDDLPPGGWHGYLTECARAAIRADEAYRREQRERHMAEAEFRERPRGMPGTFNGA